MESDLRARSPHSRYLHPVDIQTIEWGRLTFSLFPRMRSVQTDMVSSGASAFDSNVAPLPHELVRAAAKR